MERVFRFKQFSLSDHGAAMKIGTDAVLLGSMAANQPAATVLDIGTGSGIIALMIAQKTGLHIDAIEPELEAAQQAQKNFTESPWPGKFSIHNTTLQEFAPGNNLFYDLIVCNPPYFQDSLANTSPSKAMARHNTGLKPQAMFCHVARLLARGGIFMMIYPSGKEKNLDEAAHQHALSLKERCLISPSPNRQPKRVISSYVHASTAPLPAPVYGFCIETGVRHQFSEDYIRLTADYHPFL